jgi:hypothetical protein
LYFVVMFLLAVGVAVLVLALEHRGDPRLLERQYAKKDPPSKNSR